MTISIKTASRKDIQQFQRWVKLQPWSEISFLHETYLRDDCREEKLKILFAKFSALPLNQRFPAGDR